MPPRKISLFNILPTYVEERDPNEIVIITYPDTEGLHTDAISYYDDNTKTFAIYHAISGMLQKIVPISKIITCSNSIHKETSQ